MIIGLNIKNLQNIFIFLLAFKSSFDPINISNIYQKKIFYDKLDIKYSKYTTKVVLLKLY